MCVLPPPVSPNFPLTVSFQTTIISEITPVDNMEFIDNLESFHNDDDGSLFGDDGQSDHAPSSPVEHSRIALPTTTRHGSPEVFHSAATEALDAMEFDMMDETRMDDLFEVYAPGSPRRQIDQRPRQNMDPSDINGDMLPEDQVSFSPKLQQCRIFLHCLIIF